MGDRDVRCSAGVGCEGKDCASHMTRAMEGTKKMEAFFL
jgi:hypothetical protein